MATRSSRPGSGPMSGCSRSTTLAPPRTAGAPACPRIRTFARVARADRARVLGRASRAFSLQHDDRPRVRRVLLGEPRLTKDVFDRLQHRPLRLAERGFFEGVADVQFELWNRIVVIQ